jgi:hypothetical protein
VKIDFYLDFQSSLTNISYVTTGAAERLWLLWQPVQWKAYFTKGFNEIFPVFTTHLSNLEKHVKYRDVHDLLNDCEFCENQHSERHRN